MYTIVVKVTASGQLQAGRFDPAISVMVWVGPIYQATVAAPLKFKINVPQGAATLHTAMSDWPTGGCVDYSTASLGTTGSAQATALGLPVSAPVAGTQPVRTMSVTLTSYGKLTISSFGSSKTIDLSAVSTPAIATGYYLALKPDSATTTGNFTFSNPAIPPVAI